MTSLRQIYKCDICGNVVEVVGEGGGELVCCGKPMNRLEAKTEDAGKEKHVPVVTFAGEVMTVNVGSIDHPMEDKHYIKFIEVLTSDKVFRRELSPGMKPMAQFTLAAGDVKEVREYCTVHNLWKK